MQSLTFLATLSITLRLSAAWTSASAGGMKGVTYAGGTIYNSGTMCPSNVNQGYVCDGRNFGDKYLDATTMSSFCSGYPGSSTQYGFGHGVSASQKCGECAQLRVLRTDGTYNYMTVMMVDHFTWSMEVGTTEITHLVSGTQWTVGDYADFDFRLVGDCYASFDADGGSVSVPAVTPGPTYASVVLTPSPVHSGGGGGGGSATCSLSSNWGSMTITPHWGSSTSSLYAKVQDPPSSIASFEIRGFGQSDAALQSCVLQNTNAFQCSIAGGALTEPATVRMTMYNGAVYYGENLITSMSDGYAKYGTATCSASAFTVEDENEEDVLSWTVIVALVLCCLVCVAGACWVWRWRVRSKRGTAYFKEDVDAPPKEEAVEQDTTEIVVEADADADDTTQMMQEDDDAAKAR